MDNTTAVWEAIRNAAVELAYDAQDATHDPDDYVHQLRAMGNCLYGAVSILRDVTKLLRGRPIESTIASFDVSPGELGHIDAAGRELYDGDEDWASQLDGWITSVADAIDPTDDYEEILNLGTTLVELHGRHYGRVRCVALRARAGTPPQRHDLSS